MSKVQEAYEPVRLAASGNVFTGTGCLGGFFCTTGGTLQLRDHDSAGTIIISSFTVAAGTYYPLPFSFGNGCYAELTTAVGTFGYSY